MARGERLDQRAMVAEDRRSLERALAKVRQQKDKNAGERQIEERLNEMAGSQDLEDPKRYHGS
jgi:hypothetical protein